ncbi:WSC domain-containing protein [Xylariaceae sp. FL0594]|nr:WSC domain-containing protein [Xylariaceae sp. FL0594]
MITGTKVLVGLVALAARADAFFRLPCSSPVVVERSDPIVDPGAVAKHLHTVMGSDAFNFTMSYADTQAAACSTCKAVEDRSSYWVPTLFYHAQNGSFIPVKQTGGALIYYLQRSDSKDPNYKEGLIPFPKDFRMVAGNPYSRNFTDTNEQRAVSFVCLGVQGPATYELPKQNCPGGLRAQLTMPSCWDGVNVDSADHKSHMAYPSVLDNGYCPQSHPRRFVTLFYEVVWSVDDFKDMWYGDGQPFVLSTGDPTGYGYHGDFVNGWDIPTLTNVLKTCNSASGVIEECTALTLRSDDDMKACKLPPRVNEPTTGILSSLPGCNPIQPGPQPATQEHNCRGVVTSIGDPILPFTDVTKRLGWKYVACAKDPAGQPRTLSGFQADQKDMTVDKCVALCKGKGFKYAGVEYRTQCFCGNDIPQDRLPKAGLTGNCDLPCAGDATQLCGGAAQVGVYTACEDAGHCENDA